MKHIKLFENNQQRFWLMDYYITQDTWHDYELYPDQESLENAVISLINGERLDFEDNYNDDMYFTDIDSAMTWFDKNFSPDQCITYQEIILNRPFKDEKLELMRNKKKYNL